MAQPALFSATFLDDARRQLPPSGRLAGADGDFRFVVLDGNRYDLGVLDCTEEGLADDWRTGSPRSSGPQPWSSTRSSSTRSRDGGRRDRSSVPGAWS
jgi:hypothetical protein